MSDNEIKELSNYIIFIMGKSGVGKDTVKLLLGEELIKNGYVVYPIQRYITRPLHKSEQHISVTVDEFEKIMKHDQFIIHWNIYDNYYGFLRSDVLKAILNKEFIIMNISRELALGLKSQFPRGKFILVDAPERLSIKRILERNRETSVMIDQRIDRMEIKIDLPADLIVINNDGSLEDLKEQIVKKLKSITN